MKALIEKHGGLVSEWHECFTYQIAPIRAEAAENEYFYGDVYYAHWLVDSVKAGELLEKDDYFAFTASKNVRFIKFTVAKPNYTITEALKVFEIAMPNKTSASGSTFW